MSDVPDGFALPPDWEDGSDTYVVAPADPRAPAPVRRPLFSVERATSLLDALIAAGSSLRERSAVSIARTLGNVGSRLGDRDGSLHQEAVARVAAEAWLSAEGARQVVLGMARDWTADRLDGALRSDFPDPAVLDGFLAGREGERIRAFGGRLALHLCSGNVPGVGATSLVRSLLVKCPVLLKPGRTDVALPTLFARALADEDEVLARAVAVVYWPHDKDGPLERLTLERADRVVVYGGNEAVAEIRRRAPVTTPLVAYHHRLSFAAVGRGMLDSPEAARPIARAAAEAIGAYDARGCVSPRLVWVEEGGRVTPTEWAEMLADELQAVEDRVPAGRVANADAARLRQLVGAIEIRRAAGQDVLARHARDFAWIVVCGPTELAPPVTGGRAVLICPIPDLTGLPERLTPGAGVLQSFALAATAGRLEPLSEALATVGVTRITTLDRVAWPPAWWRHDGQGPLLALVRWTTIDTGVDTGIDAGIDAGGREGAGGL